MKLTKLDLARLKNFRRARERAPTPLRGLWRVRWYLLILGILAVVSFWIPVPPVFHYFVIGFITGGLFCLCVMSFLIPRLWPLTREVLNWDRIEQLIKEHDDKAA